MAKPPKFIEIVSTGTEAQVAQDYADALENAAERQTAAVAADPDALVRTHITAGATAEPRPAGVRPDRRVPAVRPPRPDFIG